MAFQGQVLCEAEHGPGPAGTGRCQNEAHGDRWWDTSSTPGALGSTARTQLGAGRAAEGCQGLFPLHRLSPNSVPSSCSALSGAPPEHMVLKQSNKAEHQPGSWVLDRGPS